MKKTFYSTIVIFTMLIFASCASHRELIPTATNTVKSVSLDEMNLTSKDYDILNRIEASASIILEVHDDWYVIKEENGLFELKYEFIYDKKKLMGRYILEDVQGVIRAGYLARDYGSIDLSSPDDIVRRLAIYRIINICKQQDGDGIIEPIISTNVEEVGGRIVYQTTVSGKVIRLKSK